MKFQELYHSQGSSYLREYLSGFNPEIQLKIIDKLAGFERLTFLELSRGDHIKHIEGKLYEVRVRIKKEQHRFLGTMYKEEFYIVHGFLKKKPKIPPDDKEIGLKRVKELLK